MSYNPLPYNTKSLRKKRWNAMMQGKGDEKCEDNYVCIQAPPVRIWRLSSSSNSYRSRGCLNEHAKAMGRTRKKRSVTMLRTFANVSKIGKAFFLSSPKQNLI